MSADLNALAAEAAAGIPQANAYHYDVVDALQARILVVEEGGSAYPDGRDLGGPDDPSPLWKDILKQAGFEYGMYSWWNAIPYGIEGRPHTAEDKIRGRKYLTRVLEKHACLEVILAVGGLAEEIVRSVVPPRPVRVRTPRSPVRASSQQREEIVETFEQARLDAYPVGLYRDE